MLYLEFNNHKYEAELADNLSEGTYQFFSAILGEFNRLGTDKIKFRNQANETTLHCWHNKDIDTILTYENKSDGTIINRYAILNVSRNY